MKTVEGDEPLEAVEYEKASEQLYSEADVVELTTVQDIAEVWCVPQT